MNVKVTGCMNCMMYHEQDGWFNCSHPNEKENLVLIEYDNNFNPITPEWCPLNKEPITIEKV